MVEIPKSKLVSGNIGRSGSLRRRALGDFLRSARARVSPESLGLPAGGRRRTPGLRREEVAALCDISVTWYTWIEQGRDISVSPAVWARLATALGLNRAERHYLFELAECADPEHADDLPSGLPIDFQACVDNIVVPAYLLDRYWNVVVWNPPLSALFEGWPADSQQPNLLHYIFLDARAPSLVVDWEQRAERVVAEFRADAAPYADEPGMRAFVDALRADSRLFDHWWTRQVVVEREGGSREFRTTGGELMQHRQVTFRQAVRADYKLVMLLPEAPASDGPKPQVHGS